MFQHRNGTTVCLDLEWNMYLRAFHVMSCTNHNWNFVIIFACIRSKCSFYAILCFNSSHNNYKSIYSLFANIIYVCSISVGWIHIYIAMVNRMNLFASTHFVYLAGRLMPIQCGQNIRKKLFFFSSFSLHIIVWLLATAACSFSFCFVFCSITQFQLREKENE